MSTNKFSDFSKEAAKLKIGAVFSTRTHTQGEYTGSCLARKQILPSPKYPGPHYYCGIQFWWSMAMSWKLAYIINLRAT